MRRTAAPSYALDAVTRAHKIANLIGVPLPLIGLVAAIVLLWDRAIGPLELGLLVGLYLVGESVVLAVVGHPGDHRPLHGHRPEDRHGHAEGTV